jgi:hypothetical protein
MFCNESISTIHPFEAGAYAYHSAAASSRRLAPHPDFGPGAGCTPVLCTDIPIFRQQSSSEDLTDHH